MLLGKAADLYLGEVARRYSKATVTKYTQVLGYFLDRYEHRDVMEISRFDCETFLHRWNNSAPATRALHTSILKRFFEYMIDCDELEVNPMEKVKRPRLPKAEDRDVTTTSSDDVRKMLKACETWQEIICLSVLIYLGPRRNAASKLRWRDIDMQNGRIRFYEKRGKVAWKPIPYELYTLLESAPEHQPDDYVIPNVRPDQVSRPERSNAVIWDAVKRVAKRAGVSAHVHSMRAAFAVLFDEAFPNQPFALKDLMGHERIETTMIYFRRRNRDKAMEVVRDLSWRLSSEQHDALTTGENRGVEVKPATHQGGFSAPVVSALSSGELADRGSAEEVLENLASLPASSSPVESASRQKQTPLPMKRPKPLPPEPVEAHTGFEPVLLLSLVAMLLQREDDRLDDTNSHAIVVGDTVTDTPRP
jgi:integrase